MNAPVKRGYAYHGERRIHYRIAGHGPPLVLLHASPGSSWALESLIGHLADRFTAIAIDTPGFGESEELTTETPEIAHYAAALADTLDALGLDRVELYGSHTGAHIALEFALVNPGRVAHLILDGMAVLTPQERADILANYLPDLSPRWDGTHLITAWMMRRDMAMFWPWYNRTPEGRLRRPLPEPERLHAMMVDFLRAIPNYYRGYAAAFRHDPRPGLARVTVPTLFLTTTDDPLVAYVDRGVERSPSLTVDRLDGGSQPRAAVAARVRNFIGGSALPEAPAPPVVRARRGVVYRSYTDTSIGEVLTRGSGAGSERPLVLFHAAPGSSAYLEPLLKVMGQDRPVVTFDNPGNGDSAPIGGAPDIWDFADVLLEAVDALGFDEFDVYGSHTGALIAMETAIKRPDAVKRVILDGITLFAPEETAEYLERYAIPLQPTSEGSHLLWAWNFRRDMALWWPWYNHTLAGLRPDGSVPPPEVQHVGYVEFMKGGLTYHLSYRAAFAYPTRARLPKITQPVLHCSSPGDPLRAGIGEAMQLSRHAFSRIHQGNAHPATHALYRAFLAGETLPDGPTQ